MLEKLWLQNFKAFEKVTIDPALLTVLIGPNGTGKSSIIQALAVLKQSRGFSRLEFGGPYLALGSYRDLIHGGDTRTEMTFGLSLNIEHAIEPLVPPGAKLTYEALCDQSGLKAHSGILALLDETINVRWGREVGAGRSQLLAIGNGVVEIVAAARLLLPFQQAGWTSVPTSDRRALSLMKEALNKLLHSIHEFLGTTYIVSPLRGFDRPSYPLPSAPAEDMTTTSGTIDAATRTAGTLAYDREMEQKISFWVERVLDRTVEARVVPDKMVSLEAPTESVRVKMVHEGFGLNQLIQPLVQLAVAPGGALVAIEELEIHLHPKAQARLCDLLVEIAHDEAKQILTTTHSEHILMAFLTAVAQGKLQSDELAIYYFERKNGYAEATRLPVDEKGRVEGGLRGFFEADIEQLDTYLQALKK